MAKSKSKKKLIVFGIAVVATRRWLCGRPPKGRATHPGAGRESGPPHHCRKSGGGWQNRAGSPSQDQPRGQRRNHFHGGQRRPESGQRRSTSCGSSRTIIWPPAIPPRPASNSLRPTRARPRPTSKSPSRIRAQRWTLQSCLSPTPTFSLPKPPTMCPRPRWSAAVESAAMADATLQSSASDLSKTTIFTPLSSGTISKLNSPSGRARRRHRHDGRHGNHDHSRFERHGSPCGCRRSGRGVDRRRPEGRAGSRLL